MKGCNHSRQCASTPPYESIGNRRNVSFLRTLQSMGWLATEGCRAKNLSFSGRERLDEKRGTVALSGGALRTHPVKLIFILVVILVTELPFFMFDIFLQELRIRRFFVENSFNLYPSFSEFFLEG